MATLNNFPKLKLFKSLEKWIYKTNLSNYSLIAAQHILGSNGSLLDELHKLGLAYKDMFVIGKIYSSNIQAAEFMTKRGIYVSPLSFKEPKASGKFTEYYEDSIKKFIKLNQDYILSKNKLLIVDDGGYLIEAIRKQPAFKKTDISAVEQTRSGIWRLSKIKNDLRFPIINVAESEVKLKYESSMIASSVLDILFKKLKNNKSLNYLIMGNGAIGYAIIRQLKQRGINCTAYDKVINRSDWNASKRQKALSEADVVIGCVGEDWITKKDLKILKNGTVFVSASSADTEFLTVLSGNISHSKNVLNKGYPINFDKSFDPIKPKKIQLTRALMLAGVLQAVRSQGKGIIGLDNKMQNSILDYSVRLGIINDQ